MHRGLVFVLIAIVLLLCPGCTTALLWNWAGEEEVPGQLVGVIPDVRGDVVLYEFEIFGDGVNDRLRFIVATQLA